MPTYSSALLPSTSGLGFGNDSLRWSGYFTNANISGNLTLGGYIIGQVFNVKAYGATGDGTTDDSVAIAAAIAAVPSSGGTVYFPDSVGYKTTANIAVSASNIRILLGSCTVTFVSGKHFNLTGAGCSLVGMGSEVSIVDCRAETGTVAAVQFGGNYPFAYGFKVIGSRAIGGGSGVAVGVSFNGCLRPRFEDVFATTTGSHGFMGIGCTELRNQNNRAYDTGGAGIWTEGDRNYEWHVNFYSELAAQTTPSQAGAIHIKSGTTANVTGIWIINPVIKNCGSTGICSNSTTYRNQRITILNPLLEITGTRGSALAGEGMALTGDHITIINPGLNKAGAQGISFWGTVTASQILGGSIKNSSFVTAGHAAIETVPTTLDTSGDGVFRRIYIAGVDCSDDASTTQLRPFRATSDTGGVYASNNAITGISGTGNINSGFDFGANGTKWDSYGNNLPGITNSAFQIKNPVTPDVAGGTTLGTNATPFSSAFIGAAATNNAQFTGTFTGARVHTFPDVTGKVGVYLTATDAAVDLASVANGAASTERTVTVTGAAFGDAVNVLAGTALEAGVFLFGKVTAADTVKWQLGNISGGAVDRASDTYTIKVIK